MSSLRSASAAIAAHVESAEVLVFLGLVLLGAGLWQLSHAAGLAAPGAVLVWYALPSRPPFVEAVSAPASARHAWTARARPPLEQLLG